MRNRSGRPFGTRQLAPMLAMGVFAASCEPPPPAPLTGGDSGTGAVAVRPARLDLGCVPIPDAVTGVVNLESVGTAPYRVTATLVEGGGAARFDVELPPSVGLTAGLPTGETATLTVTFRPCSGTRPDPTCARGSLLARVVLVDNSAGGFTEIPVSARPAGHLGGGSGNGARLDVVEQTPNGNIALDSGDAVTLRPAPDGGFEGRLRLSNNGNLSMTIGPIRLEGDRDAYSVRYVDGGELGSVVPLDPFCNWDRELEILYAPVSDRLAQATLVIDRSTDSEHGPFELQLLDPRRPRLDVASELSFDRAKCLPLSLANRSSDFDLVVDRFEIVAAPGGDAESIDDFRVDVAGCAPGAPTCAVNLRVAPDDAIDVDVCYANDDDSQTDGAILRVFSNDEDVDFRSVALLAPDLPCLAPVGTASVSADLVCTGDPASIDFSASAESPDDESPHLLECRLRVVFGEPLGFRPNPLTPETGWVSTFVASSPGQRIVQTRCTNACGAESLVPRQGLSDLRSSRSFCSCWSHAEGAYLAISDRGEAKPVRPAGTKRTGESGSIGPCRGTSADLPSGRRL